MSSTAVVASSKSNQIQNTLAFEVIKQYPGPQQVTRLYALTTPSSGPRSTQSFRLQLQPKPAPQLQDPLQHQPPSSPNSPNQPFSISPFQLVKKLQSSPFQHPHMLCDFCQCL